MTTHFAFQRNALTRLKNFFKDLDFWRNGFFGKFQKKFDFLKKDNILIILLGVLILLKYGQAETAAEAKKGNLKHGKILEHRQNYFERNLEKVWFDGLGSIRKSKHFHKRNGAEQEVD